ncbi:MAG: hypothetical protein ACYCY8_04955 [Burkholderiales bacterium]
MQFKKTLLATSALISAAAWAPQAHAIPAFARQVGMPCSACHYQHFPTLNAFGRSFKASGFTMVGSEEKIESTDGAGLSIPAVLNLAFITNIQYTKTNGVNSAPTTGTPAAASGALAKTANQGQFSMTQYSLFMGGRIADNIGFEGEVGLSGGAALASVKMPFSYDVGPGKLGIVPFTTDGLGPQQGFEPLSDGATPVHLFNQQDMAAIGAEEYIMNGAAGGAIPANGAALYYYTDQGFVNFTKWQIDSINGNGAGQAPGAPGGGSPTSNYLRAAWTPGNVAGFDTAIGFQAASGTSSTTSGAFTAGTGPDLYGATPNTGAGLTYGTYRTRMTEVDGQMLGDAGGMPLTLIASYAQAPGSDLNYTNLNGGENAYNSGFNTRKSFNIGAELGVIPNKATLQLGLRRADSGLYVPGTTNGNATDNAIMVGATYSLALNVRAEFTYSKYSGDMYNSFAQQTAGYTGNSMTAINLWMGF